MDEAKHTPGTWSFHRKLCGRDDVIVSDDAERTVVAIAFQPPAGVEQMAANGHLMAAAPELLACLKGAIEQCGCSVKERLSGHRLECWVPTAQQIVDEVEGKQP